MKGADHRIEENVLFGKYRIVSTLGTGSSGTVFLAEHLKLKIYRAIKCIPKDTALTSSLSLEDSFPTEAELLKNLNHPGIPLIYDIDEDAGFIYMIEEYIQGESLDTFVSYHENISQELIIEFGIQICDILDYLHHLSPYPILYQDLKPEHIIVCGNQLKLVDFGIASYFTEFGDYFQIYGTDGFSAPEALQGRPVSPLCDIYSLGKILEYMADATNLSCSSQLLHIIKKAAALSERERFETAASLKHALISALNNTCSHSSHLIRNIAVTGSRPGSGATHIAVSLVSIFNKMGIPAIYLTSGQTDNISLIAKTNHAFKEHNGIYSYRYFSGVPNYGSGIEDPVPENCIHIKDYGTRFPELPPGSNYDVILVILSGSDWDMAESLAFASRIKSVAQATFVCNYGNKKAAKKFARLLGKKVYCFPCDLEPYRITPEKQHLVSAIFKKKGGINKFLALIKKGRNLI